MGRAAAIQVKKMGKCSLLTELEKGSHTAWNCTGWQRPWKNGRLKIPNPGRTEIISCFFSAVSAFELCFRSMATFYSEGEDWERNWGRKICDLHQFYYFSISTSNWYFVSLKGKRGLPWDPQVTNALARSAFWVHEMAGRKWQKPPQATRALNGILPKGAPYGVWGEVWIDGSTPGIVVL